MNPSTVKTVAISRQRGSGGSYVGRRVAERLGLRYIDRDLLRDAAMFLHEREPEAARSAGPETFQSTVPSWWPRLMKAFSQGCVDGVYVPPSSAVVYEGDLFDVETRLIQEIAGGHSAVIVGRGAAQTLRGQHGVFAVRVHAPEMWRVERVQRVYGVDRRQAVETVQLSDRDRAVFVRRLAGIDWTDPHAYDLVVDTATVGLDGAVDAVVAAVAGRLDAGHTAT